MSDFIKECESTVLKVQKLLNEKDWKIRYEDYANKIHAKLDSIKLSKTLFHQWEPLYLYMNVTEAKKSLNSDVSFNLRYQGQAVATLKIIDTIASISTKKVEDKAVCISTKEFEAKNKRDFNCLEKLDNCLWNSKEASRFRDHFSKKLKRTVVSKKRNEEHRIESLLLTEFSKKKKEDKALCKIQPVKLSKVCRFPMPTPISASGSGDVTFSGANGGGIDILARVRKGGSTKLCIIEVKDENKPSEPPKKAILQGLAYAIFIRELLRSKSGDLWWKIYGFEKPIKKSNHLMVACAMPSNKNNDESFKNEIINFDDESGDTIQLQYIYFEEKNNEIIEIDSSLKK